MSLLNYWIALNWDHSVESLLFCIYDLVSRKLRDAAYFGCIAFKIELYVVFAFRNSIHIYRSSIAFAVIFQYSIFKLSSWKCWLYRLVDRLSSLIDWLAHLGYDISIGLLGFIILGVVANTNVFLEICLVCLVENILVRKSISSSGGCSFERLGCLP